MNSIAIVLNILRNRGGAMSLLEALPGAVLGILAVWLARKAGAELAESDIILIMGSGPAVSSWLGGTARQIYRDIRAWANRPGPMPHDAHGDSLTDARK